MLVQRMRAIQTRFGFLPDDELVALSRDTGVPLSRIEEVASFFATFRRDWDRPAVVKVHVCRDYTCHHRGAAELLERLPDLCGTSDVRHGLKTLAPIWTAIARVCRNGAFPEPKPEQCAVHVSGVSCLGRCDRAPVVWIERYPMLDGLHSWVVAGGTTRAIADRVVTHIAEIAERGIPEADSDSDARYEPHTNARRLWPNNSSAWAIDSYVGGKSDYRAVRCVAASLRTSRGLEPWAPKDRDEASKRAFVEEHNPHLLKLKTARLQGLGGAGEPTYDKWIKLWQQPGEQKFVVANGDESEPGTFKDRELMLRSPHLVIEGLILAGLMTGAHRGFVFVRHEYPEQIHALRHAIRHARQVCACGPDVFGSGVAFEVEVLESPGGYICGEQSALIEAIEDKRAQPRSRPPELQANGLWNMPTVVNNVETLARVPSVILTPTAAPKRLFSVSGDVKRPGVYEVPLGMKLRDLLTGEDYCGGVVGELLAVAPSGPSGGLIPARLAIPDPPPASAPELADWFESRKAKLGERGAVWKDVERVAGVVAGRSELDVLDLELEVDFFRKASAVLAISPVLALGGGIAVFAGKADVFDLAVNFTRFYRNESCGKCVPCRLGSQKLYEIGHDLLAARRLPTAARELLSAGAREDVTALTEMLGQTAICGLGHVAGVPLVSALAHFPNALFPGPLVTPS